MMTHFEKADDFEAFDRILEQAVERCQMRLLAYCLMPNHWHLVVWPHEDGQLSRFVGWLTLTRWLLPRRPGWLEHVNAPQTEAELAALSRCIQRGNPFGKTENRSA